MVNIQLDRGKLVPVNVKNCPFFDFKYWTVNVACCLFFDF